MGNVEGSILHLESYKSDATSESNPFGSRNQNSGQGVQSKREDETIEHLLTHCC